MAQVCELHRNRDDDEKREQLRREKRQRTITHREDGKRTVMEWEEMMGKSEKKTTTQSDCTWRDKWQNRSGCEALYSRLNNPLHSNRENKPLISYEDIQRRERKSRMGAV